MGLQAGVFPRSAGACSRRPPRTAVQLTAIGMRHHAYTDRERERDTAGGGGVATQLQRQSMIVEYCGWADRDQVLIEARCSVECVVCGFFEMSACKSHRYISRYSEIFEKKVAAYRPENTAVNCSVNSCLHLERPVHSFQVLRRQGRMATVADAYCQRKRAFRWRRCCG